MDPLRKRLVVATRAKRNDMDDDNRRLEALTGDILLVTDGDSGGVGRVEPAYEVGRCRS